MSMKKVKLLNTFVNNLTMDETLKEIEHYIASDKRRYIVATNVDVIMQIENDKYLKEIIDNADMALVDGTPLIWISKLLKRPIKEKISGSDLVPKVCELAAHKGYSMFLIGGNDGIADKAKNRLKHKLPDIRIVGTYAPPFGFQENEEELKKINFIISNSKPDILVACFGCPKQEKFIYENKDKYNAKVSICAGATIDFIAGNVKRAPKWMSDYGFEWFFRFLQEPKRLFKRYFIDDIKILPMIIKYKTGRE